MYGLKIIKPDLAVDILTSPFPDLPSSRRDRARQERYGIPNEAIARWKAGRRPVDGGQDPD